MSNKKHKSPDEMNGDDFSSPGGKVVHSIVYDLSGRLGRLEGGFVVISLVLCAILALLGLVLKAVWSLPGSSP